MPIQLFFDAYNGWPEPEVELEIMSHNAQKLFESRQAVTEADLVLVQTLNDMLALISLNGVQFVEHLRASTESLGDETVNFDAWWDAVLKIEGTTRFVTELVNDIRKS